MVTRKARVGRATVSELRIIARSLPIVILVIWAIHHFADAHDHSGHVDPREVATRTVG